MKKHGKASISQRFIQFRLISIIKHKIDPLDYHENKLISFDSLGINLVFNLDVVD